MDSRKHIEHVLIEESPLTFFRELIFSSQIQNFRYIFSNKVLFNREFDALQDEYTLRLVLN